jgi:hypothetical protein
MIDKVAGCLFGKNSSGASCCDMAEDFWWAMLCEEPVPTTSLIERLASGTSWQRAGHSYHPAALLIQ